MSDSVFPPGVVSQQRTSLKAHHTQGLIKGAFAAGRVSSPWQPLVTTLERKQVLFAS